MLAALVALSFALVLVCAVMVRVFRNVGPLSLEEHARRNGVVYVPLASKFVDELQTWSKPVRMRIERRDALVGELVLTTKLRDEGQADV